jgi:hypothetical protein
MSDNAYKLGREMVWSNAARLYMRSFETAQRQAEAAPRKLPATREIGHRPHESPLSTPEHLYRTADSAGVFQHATLAAPNRSKGY